MFPRLNKEDDGKLFPNDLIFETFLKIGTRPFFYHSPTNGDILSFKLLVDHKFSSD